MNEKFVKLGLRPADILLPCDCDMTRWAVVACDQFTSQPEYWEAADRIAGDAPSALRLILPEIGLGAEDLDMHIDRIDHTMDDYLARGIFKTYEESLFYVERLQSDGAVRRGIIAAMDLEEYDYTPGSGSLFRATEDKISDRLPPRVCVHRNASLELPHVLLLLDDPTRSCIEPLAAETDRMELLYDFDLMLGGGHLKGWRLTEEQMDAFADALEVLASPSVMIKKYGPLAGIFPLLCAVGDGNHSLTAAKTCYEEQKKVTPPEKWADLPSRYALVEVVDLHDDALQFEAIHRVVFGVDPQDLLNAFMEFYPNARNGLGVGHTIAYTWAGGSGHLTVPNPRAQLEIGTLQNFLDAYIQKNGGEVDYIHGEDVVDALGARPGNIGFKLPSLRKDQLFKTVICDGVLPRKTFSMCQAVDKRYYVEARKIK